MDRRHGPGQTCGGWAHRMGTFESWCSTARMRPLSRHRVIIKPAASSMDVGLLHHTKSGRLQFRSPRCSTSPEWEPPRGLHSPSSSTMMRGRRAPRGRAGGKRAPEALDGQGCARTPQSQLPLPIGRPAGNAGRQSPRLTEPRTQQHRREAQHDEHRRPKAAGRGRGGKPTTTKGLGQKGETRGRHMRLTRPRPVGQGRVEGHPWPPPPAGPWVWAGTPPPLERQPREEIKTNRTSPATVSRRPIL